MKAAKAYASPTADAQQALAGVVALLGDAFAPDATPTPADERRAANVKALGFAGKGDGAGKASPGYQNESLQQAMKLQALLRGWHDQEFSPMVGQQALQLAQGFMKNPQTSRYAENIVRTLPPMIRDAQNYAKHEGYPPRSSSVQSLANEAGMIVHELSKAG